MDVAAQFFAAARTLATHQGNLQERLADAYADHLLVVTQHDLPADLQPIFGELETKLNGGDDDDDPFQAAAAKLSDEEAKATIDRILLLYGRLVSVAS
ncbi:MAG TPA: hypothetical protein VGL99_13290 [Chloroflexota bacterium]|jgi:hypothetical protein